jgi:hypothetical protein
MGKIMAGILSPVSGKISGVVGAKWKDKAYLRAHVMPANPNTLAQQAQRSKMSQAVAFIKPLIGLVAIPLWDPFQKSMSGFNALIKANIAKFTEVVDYVTMVISTGTLSPVVFASCQYATGNGLLLITLNPNTGNNGLVSDVAFCIAYDKSTGIWYLNMPQTTRGVGEINGNLPLGLTATNLQVYACTYQKVGTQIRLVAASQHIVASS